MWLLLALRTDDKSLAYERQSSFDYNFVWITGMNCHNYNNTGLIKV